MFWLICQKMIPMDSSPTLVLQLGASPLKLQPESMNFVKSGWKAV